MLFRGFLLFLLILYSSILQAETLRSGIDRRGIDTTIRPQDNLFLFANGEWLKHTPIPADKSNYGSFIILMDDAEMNIREIIQEAVESKASAGSIQQKVGDYFTSFMDEEAIESQGLTPLKQELARIDQIETKDDLIKHFGALQSLGVDNPLGFYVDQDDKNSTQYIPVLIQSGITLPDRDYYLKDDGKYQSARIALKKYIIRVFELSEIPDAEHAADEILKLEGRLAEAQWTRTELRDANKRYNKYNIEEFEQKIPQISWRAFFETAQLVEVKELNVNTPSFFEKLVPILEETPVKVWQKYLKFQLISTYAYALSGEYVEANFALFGKELAGTPENKPRWKRAVQSLSGVRGFGVLGDAVGELYIKKHYPPVAQQRMEVLVENLLKAYELSIDDLSWMSPETKKKAKEKLAKINTKIGFTKKWRDYSKLEIVKDDLVGNLLRSAEVNYQRIIGKLGNPVDREEWFMTPQTVNAYYNASLNEIVFPAAILQPPFFYFDADDAVNYGSIGAVIGHEISHAFDDQGSKYDGDGNLENWWSDSDREAFSELTGKLVDQYEQYSPLEGKTVNGKLTLGENIADLSGMSIAYKAYLISLGGNDPLEIDGWTGPQRFFLGWAQSWRRKYRDAEMVNRLLTDPHSPSEFRAYGPCTNFDPFYTAFKLKAGDKHYRPPAERIRIW